MSKYAHVKSFAEGAESDTARALRIARKLVKRYEKRPTEALARRLRALSVSRCLPIRFQE